MKSETTSTSRDVSPTHTSDREKPVVDSSRPRATAVTHLDVLGVVGALATAAGHLLLVDSPGHTAFIFVAVTVWCGYIAYRLRVDRRVLTRWGFGRTNLLPTARWVAVLVVAALLGFGGFALIQGQLVFPAHGLLLLLLYPIWGLIQQFLVQGVIVDTLTRLPWFSDRRWAVILMGGALFGVVHANHWPLALGTFTLGLFFVAIYLRFRNLWPLGIGHGWLGTLFYLWVLGQDPWLETFG